MQEANASQLKADEIGPANIPLNLRFFSAGSGIIRLSISSGICRPTGFVQIAQLGRKRGRSFNL